MKQHFRKISYLLIAFMLIISIIVSYDITTYADAGSYVGDSDFGGFDSDYGSGSYSFDSDSFDSFTDSFAFSTGIFNFSFFFVLIVFIIVFANVFRCLKRNRVFRTGSIYNTNNPTNQSTSTYSVAKSISEIDPNFSQEMFNAYISNLYIRMQQCWQSKNWEEMRPVMTDTIYNQFKSQLDQMTNRHETNYIENISVLAVVPNNFYIRNNSEIIKVNLSTRITDYTLNDYTQEVVRGNRKKELFMTYEWTLIRKAGVKTTVLGKTSTQQCPHCGAPVDINHSAKCDYCNSIITSAQYDWSLSNIRLISQRVAH